MRGSAALGFGAGVATATVTLGPLTPPPQRPLKSPQALSEFSLRPPGGRQESLSREEGLFQGQGAKSQVTLPSEARLSLVNCDVIFLTKILFT